MPARTTRLLVTDDGHWWTYEYATGWAVDGAGVDVSSDLEGPRAVVGTRVVGLDCRSTAWDPSTDGVPFLRDPLTADPERVPASQRCYGGAIGGVDARLALALHGRDGDEHAPISVLTRPANGEWAELHSDVTADGESLVVLADAERLLFATIVGGSAAVLEREGEQWVSRGGFDAADLHGGAFAADGAAWFVGNVDDVASPFGRASVLYSTTGCLLTLDDLQAGVALGPSENGLTAWGFSELGEPARVDIGPDCTTVTRVVGERVGLGNPEVWRTGHGARPTVLASFIDDEDTFEDTYGPFCD